MRVYISSTTTDLGDFRSAVARQVRGLKHEPIFMEEYSASVNPPVEKCLRDVANCDLYVGLFAFRYGHVPTGYEHSITELEYRKAKELNRPTLIFLLDENADWPIKHVDRGLNGEKMDRLRKDLLEQEEHTACIFNSQSDLLEKMPKAIQDALADIQPGPSPSPETPAPPSPIIGLPFLGAGTAFRNRESEISDLREHLLNPDVILTCLVGPMGVGKTAVVSNVCRQIETCELSLSHSNSHIGSDGMVYFIWRGADQQTSERLFHEISRLLDEQRYKEVTNFWSDGTRNDADKFDKLLSLLPGERYLVAIDNFEDALDGDNRIADPTLAAFFEVCLTTRHALRLLVASRDWVSVSVGAKQSMRTVELTKGLPVTEAISMLRDLDKEGDLAFDELPLDVLERAVKQCGGLPSALQRVVGMLHDDVTLSLSDLLDNTALFTKQVVANLVAEQYERQSDDRRRVIEALAVYYHVDDTPVKHQGISFMLDGLSFDANVGECLSALKRNYLIDVKGAGNHRLFALQPSVQQYAYMQIPDDGEAYCKRACHSLAADYFRTQRKTEHELSTLDDLQPQLAEFDHRILAGEYNEAARLLDTIDENYLQTWGHYRTVIVLREKLIGKLTDALLVPSNLGNLGLVYRRTGRTRDSIACFEKAIQQAKEGGNSWAECRWLGELANTNADLLDMAHARELYLQAVHIAQEKGHRDLEARTLGNLAILYRQLGDIENAIDCYEKATTIDRELGNRRWEGLHVGNLGKSYLALGNVEKAIECYEGGRAICDEVQENYGSAVYTHHLAEACVALGDFIKAQEYSRLSIDLLQKMDESRSQSYALETLGFVCHCLGNKTEARQCYVQGLKLEVPETGYRLTARLAILDLDEGNDADANRLLSESAAKCAEVVEDVPHFYEALYFLGLVRMAQRRPEDSLTAYGRALEVCRAKGVVEDALRDLELLFQIRPHLPGAEVVQRLLQEAIANR